MGCACSSGSGTGGISLEPQEEICVGAEVCFGGNEDFLNQDGPCCSNLSSPLLGKDYKDVEVSDETSSYSDEEEQQEEQDQKPQPLPWGRFAVLWACSSLACGLLPGQSLFVEMFADSGVFMSSCADGKTGCTDQVLFLTSIFGAGQSLAYGFSAPIGLLFDRWGPNVTGVVGAILCAVGLLMVSGSVLGAVAGYDAQTSYLFLIGIFTCDFGSLLNSFSFMGLIWHFPGKQTVVLALINSTYQASAMLPIVAQAIMHRFGLTLSNIMLTWTVMVVACIYCCWLFTPTQAEYYQQAKKVLGMPLPKPPKKMKPCDMLSRGVKVLRQHRQRHAVSAICLAVGLMLPLMYSALAAPYGTVLFGHKSDGNRLADINVLCTTIVGLALGPSVGNFADIFGLQAIVVILALLQGMSVGLMGLASWPAQILCAAALVLFMSLWAILITRYILLYSPPNRIGAVNGVFSLGVTLIGMPMQLTGFWVTSILPSGLDAYWLPMFVVGSTGTLGLAAYSIYFHKFPPPSSPVLLPEDESELAKGFGCRNLEEVCVITHTKTKAELVRKLASAKPEDMRSLIKSFDVKKMMEITTQRPVMDLADMIEANDEDDEDEEPEAEEEGPRTTAELEARLAASNLHEPHLRSRGCYLARIIAAGNEKALREYLLNEPVEDILNVNTYLAEQQTEAEQKQQDRAFSKLISGKEFAAFLRQRPELKPFALQMMMQALEKKMASTGRKSRK